MPGVWTATGDAGDGDRHGGGGAFLCYSFTLVENTTRHVNSPKEYTKTTQRGEAGDLGDGAGRAPTYRLQYAPSVP